MTWTGKFARLQEVAKYSLRIVGRESSDGISCFKGYYFIIFWGNRMKSISGGGGLGLLKIKHAWSRQPCNQMFWCLVRTHELTRYSKKPLEATINNNITFATISMSKVLTSAIRRNALMLSANEWGGFVFWLTSPSSSCF